MGKCLNSLNTRLKLIKMLLYSVFLLVLAVHLATPALRAVCYYTSWSQYRIGQGKFLPENIDAHLCTHIIYAFAKPEGTEIKPFEWNDDDMYARVIALKNINPNLNVLLSIGGATIGSAPFTNIVRDDINRRAFIANATLYLRQKRFDGLDIDWEYPGQFESPASDKQKFLQLVQELRSHFENEAFSTQRPRLLLTGPFPGSKNTLDTGYDVAGLAATMDFINIMNYDFAGPWDNTVSLSSPLYANPNETGWKAQLNLNWTAKYYVSLGAPKEKLNLGIPTYGRSFRLTNVNETYIGAPSSGPGTPGPITRAAGTLAFYEICDLIIDNARTFFESTQRNPYLVHGSDWVGFEHKRSVREKACYAVNNGFGGVMFWELSMDDFTGQSCGEGQFPLLHSATDAFTNPGSC